MGILENHLLTTYAVGVSKAWEQKHHGNPTW